MPEALPSLRERFAALDGRLDAPDAAEQRAALRADIVALYKAVEQELAELAALKERVKELANKWKRIAPTDAPSMAPPALAAESSDAGAGDADQSTSPTPRTNGASAPADASPSSPAAMPVDVSARPVAAAPHLAGEERPAFRADHLGASTYLEKGWTLISLGEYAKAEAALQRALELAPDDPQGESLLGWAQMLQEKHDDALLNFQKVLMREPANSLARINLGYICLKKGIFGEAIEHLSKAIRLNNDRKAAIYAHFYLGLVYLEREMYEDAQTFFRKTLELGPNLIEAHYELGRALWFEGKREEALEAWRTGHAANKFSPWGKRCAEMLEHVQAGGVPARAG
ncbi:MAG TPA: tetratricopeptide repeat protein [Gemmatimonadaceae bacterium]|nr:tetratricopeptide repeat protein [Gemmatimonadaceae bacterium]